MFKVVKERMEVIKQERMFLKVTTNSDLKTHTEIKNSNDRLNSKLKTAREKPDEQEGQNSQKITE